MRSLEIAVNEWTRGTVPGGFMLDAGHYAGRPPSDGDIRTATLEGIYQGLCAEVSQDAATNFVRFVNNLVDMSASSFITAFVRFARSGFTAVNVTQKPEDRESEVSNEGQAFAIFANRLVGRVDTEDQIQRASTKLKEGFLLLHSDELA